jgi:hypothetical protein
LFGISLYGASDFVWARIKPSRCNRQRHLQRPVIRLYLVDEFLFSQDLFFRQLELGHAVSVVVTASRLLADALCYLQFHLLRPDTAER